MRRAVEFDERATLARAQVMDGAGDQFFARAGLAADQDRGLGGRDRLDVLQNRAQCGALAHDVAEVVLRPHFLLEVRLLLRQLVLQRLDLLKSQRVLDGHRHLVGDLL
jgi:hypothetical protein